MRLTRKLRIELAKWQHIGKRGLWLTFVFSLFLVVSFVSFCFLPLVPLLLVIPLSFWLFHSLLLAIRSRRTEDSSLRLTEDLLLHQLGSHDPEKRRAALEALLQKGNEAVPLLLKVLSDDYDPEHGANDWSEIYKCRLAAEGLGRLKAKGAVRLLLEALQDGDAGLRATAAWALGEIGDPQAIPALLALLADPTPFVKPLELATFKDTNRLARFLAIPSEICPLQTVEQVALQALRRLGEGELAETFQQVLAGKTEALEQLRNWLPSHRSVLCQALSQVLHSQNASAAAQAAWALGELQLVEALPTLEKMVVSWKTPLPLWRACYAAVGKLRPLSLLPRAVDYRAIDTATLPTIPDPSATPTDLLPRAAPPEEKGEPQQ